jgi:hypothetical protein
MAIDRSNPSLYPPNIQAILKRPAPAAVILGQELLEVDIATTIRRPEMALAIKGDPMPDLESCGRWCENNAAPPGRRMARGRWWSPPAACSGCSEHG